MQLLSNWPKTQMMRFKLFSSIVFVPARYIDLTGRDDIRNATLNQETPSPVAVDGKRISEQSLFVRKSKEDGTS